MLFRRSPAILILLTCLLTSCGMSSVPEKTTAAAEETALKAEETDDSQEDDLENTGETDTKEADSTLAKTKLTVEDVLKLAGREDLSWKDFDPYLSRDVGSGLLILAYEINEDFALTVGGFGTDQEPAYIRVVSAKDSQDYLDIRHHSSDEVEEFFRQHVFTRRYAGIKGHIKEVKGDMALISSDTDGFPGAFWVTNVSKLAASEELKGGTSVFVLIDVDEEQGSDGDEIYQGVRFMTLSEDSNPSQVDVLLTSPPPFTLTDPLSSLYQPFEISSGNYTWDTGDGTVVACGAAPLDEAASEHTARLTMPDYNRIEKPLYMFSTVIAPDILVIHQWDISDMGNPQAKEECITTYYDTISGIELEKNKVYQFTAGWDEENLERNGFFGTASYVLITE